MDGRYLVGLITVPSLEVGRQIASALVEQRLAACFNMLPAVNSLFHWQGSVSEEQEFLLMVKTRRNLFESRLIPAVRQIHPYETPEIIALPILVGNQDYLDWIEAETSQPDR
jgi:periplasmic divalent cation tolerance protein